MISMRIPRSSARLRILLITYCMTMGLCACGSASDSLPVDASVTGTYDDQSSADPASADTDTSSPETASPDTENTSPAGPLRDATPVCLVPQADGIDQAFGGQRRQHDLTDQIRVFLAAARVLRRQRMGP